MFHEMRLNYMRKWIKHITYDKMIIFDGIPDAT